MKSERRHELQQNDLAVYLDRINKSVEPYSKIIAIVLGIVVVGGLGMAFYNTQQSGVRSDATLQLIQASATQDAEEMLRVSETYPETKASSWARLYQGKLYLTQGIASLYNDQINAEQLLADAEAAFRYAIANSDDRLLQSRAYFGIARAAESLGNLDAAIDAYNEVIAVNESEAMVEKAEQRIETLSNPDAREFLAWFEGQDFAPPRADPSLPPALPGGGDLPDLPDLELPGLGLDLGGGEAGAAPNDGGIEMPAQASEPADSKPADSKPAESKPADSKPADSKPADSKPADSKPADSKPADSKPAESKPADSKPADSKPADSKPADSKPADSKPADSKPADSKPADSKPADSKPADSKPADSKPADSKPADSKPATNESPTGDGASDS